MLVDVCGVLLTDPAGSSVDPQPVNRAAAAKTARAAGALGVGMTPNVFTVSAILAGRVRAGQNRRHDQPDAGVLSGSLTPPTCCRTRPGVVVMLSTLAPVPTVSVPTRLRLPNLLHTTDRLADEVLSGRHDHLLRDLPTNERWYTRLVGDGTVDVWLISWVPDKSTELHDHGDSLGALTVVSGELAETRWDGEVLRQRRLTAGDQAAFPRGWIHDVVQAPGTVAPTLSVHAYSPPLTVMSYYEVTPQNVLRHNRTELTDAPE